MPQDTPLLTKSVLKVFLVLGSIALLYLGGALLIPLVVAALLALMLNPIHSWLMDRNWSNGLATAASMFVLLLFFAGLFVAVGTQGARFVEELPQIKEKVLNKVEDLKGQLVEAGGGEVEAGKNEVQLNEEGSGNMISASQASQVLGKIGGLAGNFLLMLVYVALFLSQKERLRKFLLRRVPDDELESAREALVESRDIAQSYLRARLILIAVLTVLYSIGFMLVGLDYAIVIALLAATLSIIPYVGNIIGGVIALALSMTGDGGGQQIWGIIITISLAQTLESYVLTPLIVGKEVSINPLTTIIAVVGFNIMWGPVGAIVAIPIVAMLKIICQHIDGLEDYAYLLGED